MKEITEKQYQELKAIGLGKIVLTRYFVDTPAAEGSSGAKHKKPHRRRLITGVLQPDDELLTKPCTATTPWRLNDIVWLAAYEVIDRDETNKGGWEPMALTEKMMPYIRKVWKGRVVKEASVKRTLYTLMDEGLIESSPLS